MAVILSRSDLNIIREHQYNVIFFLKNNMKMVFWGGVHVQTDGTQKNNSYWKK